MIGQINMGEAFATNGQTGLTLGDATKAQVKRACWICGTLTANKPPRLCGGCEKKQAAAAWRGDLLDQGQEDMFTPKPKPTAKRRGPRVPWTRVNAA